MASEIRKWLDDLGLGKYTDVFAENDVDFDVLADFGEPELRELGVTVGDRKRLLRAIARLGHGDKAVSAGQATNERRPPAVEAERRQLTVMFVDLVGSTALSRQLDPEDLRDVMRRYQDAVAAAVNRFGGHVAKYLGDGVLAYFGWPQAYEDQAERAVRAGLDAVKAVTDVHIGNGQGLAARVGIATGQVVVGDLVGEGGRDVEAVSGESPNLAARLQQVAEPGQVVIGQATRRLIGQLFKVDDLGGHDLHGFDQKVQAWGVAGEMVSDSRFEAAHGTALTRFVGRTAEMQQLLERWRLAESGQGQAVFLSGEAGIGKSRLAQALNDEVKKLRHFRLRYQCSPLYANSAFHPIIQRLESAAGFTADDGNADKLDKLKTLLRISAERDATIIPLFAALLSIPLEGRTGELDLEPQKRRDLTIEAMVDQILALARVRPVLFVFEDAHWIDPSTAAFLAQLIPRIAEAAVFMLITSRPEFEFPWTGYRHQISVNLDRLDREQCIRIVQAVAERDLTNRVVNRIVARADGIPLFLEELTRAVVETGAAGNGNGSEIPTSLRSSLTARLDRLSNARELARIGAVIGRSFSLALIAAVAGTSHDTAARSLDTLVMSGLITCQGVAPDATYTFKHALVQDVAYDTLLRRKRREVHARLADILLLDFPEQAETQPEQVARHLSLAGLPEKAAEYWLRAGQRAGAQSAHMEAIAHLQNGLKELERIQPAVSRDEREFALRIALGASLLTVEGWSAPKVAENYERAQDLVVSGGDVKKLFMAVRGLANVYFLNGEVENTRQLVDRLVAMALEQDDTAMQLLAYLAIGMCDLFVGEFEAALENLQRVDAMYDRAQHHALAFTYGTDPAVVALSGASWAHWFLGNLKQAKRSSDAALTLATAIDHPFSLTYAQSLAASLHQFRRDPDAVLELADAAIGNAEQHDYPYWSGWAGIMRGWALAALGNPQEGIDVLQRGFETYESTGARQIRPYILTMLAEIYGWAGLPQQGIGAVAEAFGDGNPSDVCFYEAEALRVRAVLALQIEAGDAGMYLARAMVLARRHGTRMLELRTALNAHDPDRRLIRALVDTFDPELSEPDLLDARRILNAAVGRT